MILQLMGNRLFCGPEEFQEQFGTHGLNGPAHFQNIKCAGLSPKGTRIVSVDNGVVSVSLFIIVPFLVKRGFSWRAMLFAGPLSSA